MLGTLLGLIIDLAAGLVVAGVLAALAVAALPTRPGGQAWLWGLAVVSIITIGTARRYLISDGRSLGPFGWVRRIASRRGPRG